MARSYSAGEGNSASRARALGGGTRLDPYSWTSIPRNFVINEQMSSLKEPWNGFRMAESAKAHLFEAVEGLADHAAVAFGARTSDSMKWVGSNEKRALNEEVKRQIEMTAKQVSDYMNKANFPSESFPKGSEGLARIMKDAQEKIIKVYNPVTRGKVNEGEADKFSIQRGNLQVGSDMYSIAMNTYANVLLSATSDPSRNSQSMQALATKIGEEVGAYGGNNRVAGETIGLMLSKVIDTALSDLNISIGVVKAKLQNS